MRDPSIKSVNLSSIQQEAKLQTEDLKRFGFRINNFSAYLASLFSSSGGTQQNDVLGLLIEFKTFDQEGNAEGIFRHVHQLQVSEVKGNSSDISPSLEFHLLSDQVPEAGHQVLTMVKTFLAPAHLNNHTTHTPSLPGNGPRKAPPPISTQLEALNSDDLLTKLKGYKNWVDFVFFRYSDLQMMHHYITQLSGNYNDIFFSGSTIDFGEMANADLDHELRSAKLNIEGDDLNTCFTLKAEPIMHLPANARVAVTSEGSVMPAVWIGAPCPHYWKVWKELTEQLIANDPDSAADAFSRIVSADLGLQQFTKSLALKGSHTNPNTPQT